MKPQIALNKLTLGELFSQGFSFFKQHFVPLIIITIAVYLPLNFLLEYGWAWFSNNQPIDTNLSTFRLYLRINQMLENLIGVISTLAYVRYVEESLWNRSIDGVLALQHGLQKWIHGVGTSLVAGVIVLGLTLLLIVPGLIWAGYYIFALFIVAVRNTGGKAALDYSKGLVKGRWWEVVGYILVFNLIALGTVFVFGFIIYSLIPFEALWLDVIVGVIGSCIYAPFTIMQILYFLNLDYLLLGTENQADPTPPGSQYEYLARMPSSSPADTSLN